MASRKRKRGSRLSLLMSLLMSVLSVLSVLFLLVLESEKVELELELSWKSPNFDDAILRGVVSVGLDMIFGLVLYNIVKDI